MLTGNSLRGNAVHEGGGYEGKLTVKLENETLFALCWIVYLHLSMVMVTSQNFSVLLHLLLGLGLSTRSGGYYSLHAD